MEAVRDPGGTVVELTYSFLNEAAARLYGRPVDEVIGHGQCELFPSVRDLGIWDTYVEVIESGSPTTFDVPCFHENGVEGSFRLTATKFGDGLLVSATDTTAQMKAERALEEDRATLRASADSVLDPLVRLEAVRDESGAIIDFVYADANPAACAYINMPYEVLVGAHLLDLTPGLVAAGLLDRCKDVVETGEPLILDEYAYGLQLRGGQQRLFDIRASRIRDGLSCTWRDITDRHVAERRLRATYDSMLDPHVLYEAIRDEGGEVVDFRFADANPAACEYNRWDREQLIGSTLLDQWPDFANDATREAYAQVLATGEPIMLDDAAWSQERLFGGQIRHYDLRAVKISDSLLSVTWRDITDRHEAAEYASRMAAVVEYSGDAIVGGTPEGIITSWNPAAERMYGYTAEEIIGTSGYELTPEHLRRQSHANADRVIASQQVQKLETERIRKDGTVFPVSLTISPVLDAEGSLVGIAAIHRDLSEQKEAAKLTRAMIEAGLDSMVSISPDGLITDANQATVRLTGVPRDELIGTSFSSYFTEPDKAEHGFQQALEKGSITDYPLTLHHHDGDDSLVEVQYNASTYRDLSGELRGVFAVARDVTEQLQVQREIAEQQDRERVRLDELEQFRRLTVGRELKMVELKKEIEYLKKYGTAGGSDPGEGFDT
jgi:PAS domain S-box-containing protein